MKKFIKENYKKLSVKGLSVAISPTIIGDVPSMDDDTPTFYVLDEYSRANSLLLEDQIKAVNLPSALAAVNAWQGQIDESSAMIFLNHRRAKDSNLSPRLERLIQACLDNSDLNINLVPVTILWGRSPDKEESLFKLLLADEWRVPSIGKQLFNIGVMGRDTFVQFYEPKSLQQLIADANNQHGDLDNKNPTAIIQSRLKGYLLKQRTSILGPDLSDKRNISSGILKSDAVQKAIMTHATATGKSIDSIKKEAKDYINEIASDYSYSVVRAFSRFLTWLWTQLYDGVEVHHFEQVRSLAPDYQVVYVPCHRSHMDYLLLSYVIYNQGLRIPHVAAGANLNLPMIGEILRSGGAFFLRRSFRDNPLYGTVFKEYLYSLMQRAAPIEYFIEGGRSRSGRLLAPKLGMVAMTVASHLKAPAKPVVFIPAYLSYERIMEGASYVGELKGKPKESENLLGLIKTAKKIERIFGTVYLSFGKPLYLDDFIKKFELEDKSNLAQSSPKKDNPNADDQSADAQNTAKTQAMIQNIGIKIMQHINKAVVVNPVSFVSLVLLSTPKAVLDESQLVEQLNFYQTIAKRLPYDDDAIVTTMPASDMIEYAKKLKLIERTPHLLGDVISVADKQATMLSYFKNNILHVFIVPSLLAALVQRNGHINRADLYKVAGLLYPFLQTELFLKYPQKQINTTIDEILAVLIELGVIVQFGDIFMIPDANSTAYQSLVMLANPAQQSLERYFMTLTLLAKQGSGKLSSKQVVDLCHLIGGRVSVLYGDDLPDSFDKALFAGFLEALERMYYISHQDDLIYFDERINQIAHYARFVLNPETLTLLHQATQLSDDDLKDLNQKQVLHLKVKG